MKRLRLALLHVRGAAKVIGAVVLGIVALAVAWLVARRRAPDAAAPTPGAELAKARVELARARIEAAQAEAVLTVEAARGKEEGLRQELRYLREDPDEERRLKGLIAAMKRVEGARP